MRRSDICALLRGTLDAALAIDGDGRVCYLNPVAERVFGNRVEIGRTACTTVLQGCGPHGQSICCSGCAVLQRAADGLATESFECSVETNAGRRWFDVSTILIPPRDGGLMIIHILHDTDIRKKAELLIRSFVTQFSSLTGAQVDLQPPQSPHLNLTHQEENVLRRLAEGKGTKEIATQMGLSVATVRNHIHHILRRLAVHSRTEAVLRAVRERLV